MTDRSAFSTLFVNTPVGSPNRAVYGVREVSSSAAGTVEVPERPDAEGGASRSLVGWLVFLTAVGALLRFYRLGHQSLWVDEILTLQAANVGGTLTLRDIVWNIQGPLHATLTHFVAKLSTSEPALRAASAVAGTATIPVVCLLGRDMAGRRVGLLAAALTTFSPFAVWYSQEVRNYSFLMLLAAASTLLVWRLLKMRRRGWWIYVLTMAMAIQSNLSAVFLASAHNIFAAPRAIRDRRLMGRWVAAYVVILILSLPIFLGVVRWVEVDDVGGRIGPISEASEPELLRGETTFTPAAVPYAFFALAYGYSLGPSLTELHLRPPMQAYLSDFWLIAPAGLLLAAAVLLGIRALCRRRAALLLLASMVVVTLAGAALLAFMNVKPFNARYVAVMFPALVVLVSAGVASLGRARGALLFSALAFFLLLSLGGYYFNPRYYREDVRAAAGYIEARERSGDAVLVPVVRDVFRFYYGGDLMDYAAYRSQTSSDAAVDELVSRVSAGHSRLWFVQSRLWRVDPEGRVAALIRDRYRPLDEVDFPGVRGTLFELEEVIGAQ
mgnify:CR=1 FL=1